MLAGNPEHLKRESLHAAGFSSLSRRRPTLPHSPLCSTIGAEGLNFRVRKGNGCDSFAMAAGNLYVIYMQWHNTELRERNQRSSHTTN
jgi:hypothetical protein